MTIAEICPFVLIKVHVSVASSKKRLHEKNRGTSGNSTTGFEQKSLEKDGTELVEVGRTRLIGWQQRIATVPCLGDRPTSQPHCTDTASSTFVVLAKDLGSFDEAKIVVVRIPAKAPSDKSPHE